MLLLLALFQNVNPPFTLKTINGKEIGIFEVLSKTYITKRISRNITFLRNAGEWAKLP